MINKKKINAMSIIKKEFIYINNFPEPKIGILKYLMKIIFFIGR